MAPPRGEGTIADSAGVSVAEPIDLGDGLAGGGAGGCCDDGGGGCMWNPNSSVAVLTSA